MNAEKLQNTTTLQSIDPKNKTSSKLENTVEMYKSVR